MDHRIEAYRAAGRKAALFQIAHQRPDGGLTGDDYQEDVYHKSVYSLAVAGFWTEAHRLAGWIWRHDLQASGELRHYYSPGCQQVYKDAWMIHGLHRIGRFDLSYPVMDHLEHFQMPCGGFPMNDRADPYARALTTAWCGVAALYLGRLEVARRAGYCILQMHEQQPEEGRWYYLMLPDGRLVTPTLSDRAECIDAAHTDQCYWEVGIAIQLLCRLRMATGEERYTQVAKRLFEFNLSCQPDGFAHANSGKNGLGAALLYLITGDPRARDAACREGDFLVETQEEEGGWRFPQERDYLVTRLDHAAEYNIWLQEIANVLASMDRG